MENDKDEKISKLLKGRFLSKPPADLLNHFEEQVFQKINVSETRFAWGWFLGVVGFVGVCALLVWGVMGRESPGIKFNEGLLVSVPQAQIEEEVRVENEVLGTRDQEVVTEEAALKEDLAILEMLGEDLDLWDDLNVEMDDFDVMQVLEVSLR